MRDKILHSSIIDSISEFKNTGKSETLLLKKAKNFLVRTEWDLACVKLYNKEATLYHSKEFARDIFYRPESKWAISKCEPHSIFARGGGYSVKGLHYILFAMPVIVCRFPDAKLYVASGGLGKKFNGSMMERIKISTYERYLKRIIRELHLENAVVLLDTLTDIQMCEYYKRANVFVSASTIENSSNCIAEAMLVGVPIIASYVGGTPSVIENGETGYLYPYESYEMLAYHINNIFSDTDDAVRISGNEVRQATGIYNRNTIYDNLVSIYSEIKNKKYKESII